MYQNLPITIHTYLISIIIDDLLNTYKLFVDTHNFTFHIEPQFSFSTRNALCRGAEILGRKKKDEPSQVQAAKHIKCA